MLGFLGLSLRVGLPEAYEDLFLPCKVPMCLMESSIRQISAWGSLGSSLVASWMHLLGEAKKYSHFGDSPYGRCTI